ncbi:MAG: glycosyltransferase [Flavobacteriaceae bacterium]|nr:glycosyltransferase [Flavobacteriaceae bacterium]
MLKNIIESSPKELDLTNEQHSEFIIEAVEAILEKGYTISELEKLEDELIADSANSNIFILLALKIAKSKILSSKVAEPLFISVVFAVYKEHNRIKKKSEHPHGEDFLVKKANQLEWLFNSQPDINWELIIVDDGCPERSGEIAQSIIDENKLNDKVRVLQLSEAIDQQLPPAKSIESTNDSQKGGSIVYGMWDAVQHKREKDHIVVYTDADLSTHLGQLMLLVNPLLNQDKLVAIGSRREPKSVVIKKGSRNDRGKMFIYLWKRLIPNLGEIIDTQCGFKAFRSEIIPEIIVEMIEQKFAFDIELLLRTHLIEKNSIAKVAIAWIDSEEASTTTDIQPYLPMLKQIVKMYKKYFDENELSNEFASFIESLNDEEFDKLLNNIPKDITNREPMEFTDYDAVRVSSFRLN